MISDINVIAIQVPPCVLDPETRLAGFRSAMFRCGGLLPLVAKLKDLSVAVYIGEPRVRAAGHKQPDLIVPWNRWRGDWDKVSKFIRGHHRYWALMSRGIDESWRWLDKIADRESRWNYPWSLADLLPPKEVEL